MIITEEQARAVTPVQASVTGFCPAAIVFRKLGVGSALLVALMDEARRRGHAQAALSAQTHAIDFYRRHGYGVLAQIAGYPNEIVKYLLHKAEA
mgnify:CR=1 FL=1